MCLEAALQRRYGIRFSAWPYRLWFITLLFKGLDEAAVTEICEELQRELDEDLDVYTRIFRRRFPTIAQMLSMEGRNVLDTILSNTPMSTDILERINSKIIRNLPV